MKTSKHNLDISYFKLEKLSFEVTKHHGAKKVRDNRYDCTEASLFNDENSLLRFTTKSGRMVFGLRPALEMVKASPRRMAQYLLSSSAGNLTSLFNLNNDKSHYWGNDQRKKNGYLIRTDELFSFFEVYVLHDQCFSIEHYYQLFREKDFILMGELEKAKARAEQFYNYSTPVHI